MKRASIIFQRLISQPCNLLMHIEQFRDYCLAKPGTTEDFPFGETTLVLKVVGKIFALTGLDNEIFEVNLKCEPAYAEALRERHPEVRPGYHMNKKHWNTVDFSGRLSDAFLYELIDHSYEQTVKTLKKAEREALFNS
jgi:predicted DNA-binding protein (MmcQ/YjbR family)